MFTLKDYLSQKFNSSLIAVSFLSWFVSVLLLIIWGYYSSSNDLSRDLKESSKTVTSLTYDRNWGLINEHFHSREKSGEFSYVLVKARDNNAVIYESRILDQKLIPELCGENTDSELLVLKACKRIIQPLVLWFVTISMLLYSVLIFGLFRMISTNILHSINVLSLNIKKILDEAYNDGDTEDLGIYEIEEIREFVISKTEELKKISQEAAYIKLSQKVVHDLRSPLAVIANIANKANFNSKDREVLLDSSLMLKEISNYLLDTTIEKRLDLPRLTRTNIIKEISNAVQIKNLEYQAASNVVTFDSFDNQELWGFLNITEFRRVISNILNNAIESNSTPCVKVILEIDNRISLSVRDNGNGFNEEILSSFNNNKPCKSTKLNGFGIGLGSSKTTIQKMGGSLTIMNSPTGGAIVNIEFPPETIIPANLPMVLIDDDKYIRQSWATLAKDKKIIIQTFASFNDFKLEKDNVHPLSEIFIDSELHSNLKGEELINEIFEMGFRIINIETGHDENAIQITKHLNNIISKEFPYK